MKSNAPGKFSNLFKGFFQSEKVAGLLLLLTTAISLAIANSSLGERYVQLLHDEISLTFPDRSLNYSLEQIVNDGFMTVFFLMVGLEVEREIYAGELSDLRKAILPVSAALGGMVVPSIIHFIINRGTATQPGFAIPMATDIAFALGVLALAGKKVPTSVKVFLAALAIIDDIGAIVVIAFFYTKTISTFYLIAAFATFIVLLVFNRLGIKKLVFYLVPGILLWYCFLESGVHATLSGVLLAFAIPFDKDDNENVSLRLQSFLHKPVGYLIVPIFALVNTAIIFPESIIDSIWNRNGAGIIFGLVAGKVVGIVLFPLLLIKTRLATLQEGIDLRLLTGIGFLGGIGFTMSMFITNLAFDSGTLVVGSKLCILIGSCLSALTGLIILTRGSAHPNRTAATA